MDRWAAQEGTPSPLGVTWVEEEQAYNFALYSKYATGVTLLLYAANDVVTPASVSSVGGFIEQDHIAGGCIFWHFAGFTAFHVVRTSIVSERNYRAILLMVGSLFPGECGLPPQCWLPALWQDSPVVVALTCFIHGLPRNHAHNDSCITLEKREFLSWQEAVLDTEPLRAPLRYRVVSETVSVRTVSAAATRFHKL